VHSSQPVGAQDRGGGGGELSAVHSSQPVGAQASQPVGAQLRGGGGQPSAVRSSQLVGAQDRGGGGGELSAVHSSHAATMTVKSVTTNKYISYRQSNGWLSKYHQIKAKSVDHCSFHGCFDQSKKTPCTRCKVNSGPLAIVSRFCGRHNNHKEFRHMTELESFGLWVDILKRSETLRGYFGLATEDAFLKLSMRLHSANIAPSSFIFARTKDMQQLCDDIACLIV
jgi:hypothetical protein